MTIHRSRPEFHTAPRAALLAAVGLFASGCDQSPQELVDDINAVRSECTEEMLKNADEACVRMFEQYAEMGEDMIETYIGGIRALDEALRRRGGLQFDTAGLARVFSDSLWTPPPDPAVYGDPLEPARVGLDTMPADPFGSRWGTGDSYGDRGWRSAADRDPTLERRGPGPGSAPPPVADPSRRRQPVAPSQVPRRGVLLPPEQRLRRPWIGDATPPEPYVEEETRGRTGQDPVGRPRESGDPGPFLDIPPEALDPRAPGSDRVTREDGRARTPGE